MKAIGFEVMVNGSEVKLVRKRETLEQLVQNELPLNGE